MQKNNLSLLSPEHAGLLEKIHAASFPKTWNEATFRQLLLNPAVFGFFIPDQGFILCQEAGGEAEILTFAVMPEARRKKIGTALLKEALLYARRKNCSKMFLEVSAKNEAAQILYGKEGFEKIGVRPKYYKEKDGMSDAIVFCKKIIV